MPLILRPAENTTVFILFRYKKTFWVLENFARIVRVMAAICVAAYILDYTDWARAALLLQIFLFIGSQRSGWTGEGIEEIQAIAYRNK